MRPCLNFISPLSFSINFRLPKPDSCISRECGRLATDDRWSSNNILSADSDVNLKSACENAWRAMTVSLGDTDTGKDDTAPSASVSLQATLLSGAGLGRIERWPFWTLRLSESHRRDVAGEEGVVVGRASTQTRDIRSASLFTGTVYTPAGIFVTLSRRTLVTRTVASGSRRSPEIDQSPTHENRFPFEKPISPTKDGARSRRLDRPSQPMQTTLGSRR